MQIQQGYEPMKDYHERKRRRWKIGVLGLSLFILFCCINPGYADETQDLVITSSSLGSGFATIQGGRMVSGEDQAILDAYRQGDSNAYRAVREQRAEQLGLLEAVDKDYYLKESALADHPEWLESSEIDILIPYMSEEELETYLSMQESGIMLLDGVESISGIYSYQFGINWSYSCWHVSDGLRNRPAFCANYYGASPKVTPTADAKEEVSSEWLRKVVYYGYGGPKDILSSKYGTSGAIVASNLLASYANGIYPGSNEGYWRYFRDNFDLDWFFGQPSPPAQFHAYLLHFNQYDTNVVGDRTKWQPLLYGYLEEPGTLSITKTSLYPEISNANYSLPGAVYGIYKDQGATSKVGELTILDNGKSNTVTLEAGTYYLKETKAPDGYALDSEIHPVRVTSLQENNVTMQDEPLYYSQDLLLKKVDVDDAHSTKLAGAEFTVKFYDVITEQKKDLSGHLKKTWRMQTDEYGQLKLNRNYLISGDSFYEIDGQPVLPLGTLTIQEVKAPSGYQLNDELLIVPLTLSTTKAAVLYQVPTLKELPVNLKVVKKQQGEDAPLEDVSFLHTMPDGKTETLTTDKNGAFSLNYLAVGKHVLKETKPIPGLKLLDQEIVFTISEKGAIELPQQKFYERNDDTLTIYNEPSTATLKVRKVNNHDQPLSDGGTFRLSDDNGVVASAVLDDGIVTFTGIGIGKTYYLTETKPPKGYRLPEPNPVYKIKVVRNVPSDNVFCFEVNDRLFDMQTTTDDVYLAGNQDERIITLKIENECMPLLPETGSKMIPVMLAGSLCLCVCAIYMMSTRRTNDK